jgi:FkbM family methyltransferase
VSRFGPFERALGIARELSVVAQFRLADWPRIAGDVVLFRVMRFARVPREGAARTVHMRDGTMLTYRLNRGDIQAIREIWRERVYMPGPDLTRLRQLVDLGANIGFTSVYLSRLLDIDHVVAVEPDPDNVQILRRNLKQNGLRATVLQAAVGPFDSHARFSRGRASNIGHLDQDGDLRVRVVSMPYVIDRLPSSSTPTLLKMDIEGGEEQLFTGDVSWLRGFDCVMAELHPHAADLARITDMIEASGLRFREGGGPGGPTACWVRHEGSASRPA